MTSLKTSIKTITYLSDTGCLEIQGASLFMLITLLVILIAKPSTGLGEVLVTINLLNALVWLAINLVNRLRERLVSHRDQQ